jgi:hypothetical protein
MTNRPSSWSSVSNRRAPGRERSAYDRRWGPGNSHATFQAKTQRLILNQCPHATADRTFHGWLAGGRVVCKGQKGIRIVAPDTIEAGTVTAIRHMHVFDVTQTQARTQRAA